jgi:hypothetical protein
MGVDFSESSLSTEQKNDLEFFFHQLPSKGRRRLHGQGVRFSKPVCIFEIKMMMKSCLNLNKFQIRGLQGKLG